MSDDVYILQQFWRAEIRDRKVTYRLADFGNGSRDRTTTGTYRTRSAAERAAQIELAKKIRLGYQVVPAPELAALERFANKTDRERGDRVVPKPVPKTYACRRQRFWRAERAGRMIVTIQGDIGGDASKTTQRHAALIELEQEGYHLSTARELGALRAYVRKMNERLAHQPAVSTSDLPAIPAAPSATIVPRKPPPRAATVNRKGPFARTFTGPNVHFIKMSPTKLSKAERTPRATSGGRPIMAEGQAWPTCCQCREPLSLYLQFDIEPAMQLGFIPGSHLLVFNCAACKASPMIVPYGRLPKEWLSPDNPQTYRVILNPPAACEGIFRPDPTMLEQRVRFTRLEEKVSRGSVWRGRDGLKIGGIPAKIQGWEPPRCHCGAPLGFAFQEPVTEDPGWRSSRREQVMAFGLAFIYACTKQCSPYATIVIPDR